MRSILSVLALLLLVSCAARNGGPAPAGRTEPVRQENSHSAKLQAGSIEELKSYISRNLTSAEKARIGFSSHGDETSRKIAEKLVQLFPRSFSLELAGLGGLPPEEVMTQLDARTTPALVFIHYRNEGDLLVSLFATDGSFSRELFFDYRYSDAPAQIQTAQVLLGSIAMKPRTAICDGDGNIYLGDGEKIVVTSPDPGKELLRKPSSCADPSFFISEGVVSLFCASTSKGISFTRKGQVFEEKELTAFPLPPRAERFIYTDKDENGYMAVFNKEDEKLGSFTELCVFKNNGTTVFAGISPEGDVWGLRGDLISVVPSTLKGPYAHLSAAGRSFFALRGDGVIEEIELDEKFEWKLSEVRTKIKEGPAAIAWREGHLLLFCPEESGTAVYSISIPPSDTGGE